tara:strand:+ start:60 stop:1874 length:1815 start_codon:yes stop_codon:yes gene_type:complete
MSDFVLSINYYQKKDNEKKLSDGEFISKEGNFYTVHQTGSTDLNDTNHIFENDEIYIITRSNIINPTELGDAEFIYSLYEKDKNNFVSNLQGGFSFVVINKKNREIIVATDHFHLYPVFYIVSSEAILISTSIKFLKKFNKGLLDEEIIFDYLMSGLPRKGRTIFKDINVLENNCFMKIKEGATDIHKYNEFKCKIDEQKNEKFYIENFKKLFYQVINEQLKKTTPKVASTLSGGLDSSSIVCVANDLISNKYKAKVLETHSSVFAGLNEEQTLRSDEYEYMQEVINSTSVTPYFHKFEKSGPLSILDEITNLDEPALGPNIYSNFRIMKDLEKRGVEFLFEGLGGDSAISHGHGRFYQLGKSFRVFTLLNEYKTYCVRKKIKFDWLDCLKRFFLMPLVSPIVKLKYKLNRNKDDFFNINLFVKKEFEIDTGKKFEEIHGYHPAALDLSSKSIYFYESLSANDIFEPYANRVGREISKKFNINLLLPFNDKRIREFCLNVPLKFKLKNGIDRYFFRESLKNSIPRKIYNRSWKSDMSGLFLNEMLEKENTELINIIFDNDIFKKILDRKKVNKFVQKVKVGKNQKHATSLYKLVYLGKWIKKNM